MFARSARVPLGQLQREDAAEVRVIQLLEQGRITAREAADLIAALKGPSTAEDDDRD